MHYRLEYNPSQYAQTLHGCDENRAEAGIDVCKEFAGCVEGSAEKLSET
jgi:hypothetical protein